MMQYCRMFSFLVFFPLLGTWSYLRICRRSMLPYTRFCKCPLEYNYMYVLHIVNFPLLYVNIFISYSYRAILFKQLINKLLCFCLNKICEHFDTRKWDIKTFISALIWFSCDEFKLGKHLRYACNIKYQYTLQFSFR